MSKCGEHMGQNCLPCRKDEGDYFSRNFECILRTTNDSPHGKFHRFLFPFPSKFPDLNFTPFVLYIYPCHETRTWHTQWACVTCNIPILRVRVDSLQIDLFLKKECCLGVRVRVRGSVFPLSCNFYVTNVNFTRVRYKLAIEVHVCERPFIHCLYFLCEWKFYARIHVTTITRQCKSTLNLKTHNPYP